MNRIFSNGPNSDFVIRPYQTMIQRSSHLLIAAPFVTRTEELAEAANQGKSVSLLAGLNVSTSPEALSALLGVPNCEVRYLTTKFHAKIFIFDEEALLGSSNLTMGGLQNNREATVVIDDIDEVDELKAIFSELWESAQTLTPEKLKLFTSKREMYKNATDNFNQLIEAAVGKAEPPTLRIESRKKTAKSKYLEALSRDIEQYRAAFNEVKSLLEENQLRRTDLEDVGMAMETNRFLNWLRLTHIHGDEPWQSASFKSKEDRKREILQFGKEWVETPRNKVPKDYVEGYNLVKSVFGTRDGIKDASKEHLTEALLSIHAFLEQSRFTSRGDIPGLFWQANANNDRKVREALIYLLHGSGEFLNRLHDFLYDSEHRLGQFGRFCALELYGTIKPDEFPPVNGRMAKALRFLGYNVRGR
jgi:hypothetical protein